MPHPVKTHEWRTKASVSPGSIISHWATHQIRLSWFNQKLVMSLQNVEIRKHSGNYHDSWHRHHRHQAYLYKHITYRYRYGYIYIKYMHMHVHIPKHDLATFASIPLVYHRHQRVAPLQPPTSSLRLPRKRYIYIYIHVYIYIYTYMYKSRLMMWASSGIHRNQEFIEYKAIFQNCTVD